MTAAAPSPDNPRAAGPDSSSPWLYCRPSASPPRFRLFCLPHAGGGSANFRGWNPALLPSVQICSVLLPGREQRAAEPLYTQFDPLADALERELRPWLDRPFAVFGHSMGALLAFEWVRRLARAGGPLPAWLFLSGRQAPDADLDAPPLHSLPNPQFLDELNRRYQGIPQEIAADPDFLDAFLPVLRADIAIVEDYRFRPSEPLDCPIAAFTGLGDPSASWRQLLAWKRQTRRRFAVHVMPGGHFYPPQPLLATIASTLAGIHS